MRTSSSSLVCRQSVIKLKSYGTRVIENAIVVDLVESVVWDSFAVRVMLFVLRLMLISRGVARKKLRGGPNFATFNVTPFNYNGILPFVNYARRY